MSFCRLIIRFTLHVVVAIILSFLYDNSIGKDNSCLNIAEPEEACMVREHIKTMTIRS